VLRRLSFRASIALAASCASCNSAGGVVNPADPLNPAAGATQVPSAQSPTPTPTQVGATPTPVATSGTLACTHNTTPPYTQMNYALGNGMQSNPQPAVTLVLPDYPSSSNPVIHATASLPTTYTTNGMGTTLTVKVSQANFDNVQSYSYGNRTPDLFSSVEVNPQDLGVGDGKNNDLIPVTVTSPCIVPGTTYTVNEVALGASLYTETDTPTSTTVTGHIETAINPFTHNEVVDFIVSH
jgi:hypothetical protein